MPRRALIAVLVASGVGACGGGDATPAPPLVRIGVGPRYELPAAGAAVRGRQPVRGLACSAARGPRDGAHVELFAARRTLLVPAGVGIAPPHRRAGRYVTGPCSYPLRTRERTGVVELAATGRTLRVADLFAVWGQALGPRRLAGFTGPVRAWVDGRRWPGSPGAVPLRRHAQIVVEVGGYVRPHATYRFPPGL